MAAWRVALLLGWLGCGSALWRYYTNSPNFRIFSVRSTIYLEYEGASFSEWLVPESCSIKDKRSAKTELRCSSPGFQHIQPVVTGSVEKEDRYLFMGNSHNCFIWYYKVEHLGLNLTQILDVWVYDPESASQDELLWNASQPSPNSIILTKMLFTMGQKPIIYTITRREKYFPTMLSNQGVWKITVPIRRKYESMDLRGNNVVFQDCFITNLNILLTTPLVTMPSVPVYLPLSSPAGSELIADWNACVSSSTVLVSDIETFQTNDSFRTWTKIRVPPGILSDNERHSVTDVCLSEDKIFFVINGNLYLKSFYEFTKLGKNDNLPDGGIVGITSRKWCWTNYLRKLPGKRSHVAIWTENEVYLGSYSYFKIRRKETHNLFVFKRIMTTTKLKKLLYLSSTATLTIHTIEYTAHPLELALFLDYCIICTSNKNIYLLIYNEDTEQWIFQDFTLAIPIDSVLVSRFLYSAMPEFLLWDQHRIYYNYHNFTYSGVLQTPTHHGNLSSLSQNSTIHNVFLDNFGNIVIKMKNNIMFHSKINVRDAIQLPSWTNKTMKSFFGLDTSGQLYIIYVFKNGMLQTEQYPLKLEVQSASFQTNEKCPYLAFHNSLIQVFYFLDKRDVLSVWAQITYPENIGIDIILESYGPTILEERKTFHYQTISGYNTKTMMVRFYQTIDYETVDDYFKLQEQNSGVVLYNIRPSKYSKSCPAFKKVFQVAVGCNSKKYITIKGFPRECYRHNFSYVIDKSYLRHQPSENLKVKYNWPLYGCPLRLNFRKNFKPVIQLYNETGYVEDVQVNFIVWEIHGRNDYSFNYTMKNSGCLNEAQTWKAMTELNKHLPLERAWGPENYKTCFSYAIGKPGDLDQPYEIINKSNYNHIIWSQDHSGMYVFGVKILDPNYSFCNLTTIFAIKTFGLVPRPNGYVVASFVFLLMLLFSSILVLSYFQYMKIYKNYIYEPIHIPRRKHKKM